MTHWLWMAGGFFTGALVAGLPLLRLLQEARIELQRHVQPAWPIEPECRACEGKDA